MIDAETTTETKETNRKARCSNKSSRGVDEESLAGLLLTGLFVAGPVRSRPVFVRESSTSFSFMRGSLKIKADRRAGMRVVTSLTGSKIGVFVDIIIGIVVVASLDSKRIIINDDNS